MTESNHTPSGASPREEKRPARSRRRRRSVVGTIFKVLGTLLLVGVTTGVFLVCFAAIYLQTIIIPEAKNQDYLGELSLSLTSTMYYTNDAGQDLAYLTINSKENRIWVEYDEIPVNLKKALVATEDKRFFTHHGVDWLRTANGVLRMFTGQKIQGGSTITQQLIKNITGEDQATVKRKITEIFRALEFDKTHTKQQTLEWYLNMVYFGESCYGVGSASYAYFGKSVEELSMAQCASLVGITNNPSRYDPYLNKETEVTNEEANRKRTRLVLQNMYENNMISEEEMEAAKAEADTMEFVRGSPEGGGVTRVYNWYQEQVISDVIRDLMEKYGWSEQLATNKLYYGGLSIFTNVDPDIQAIVDEVYTNTDNIPYISNSGQQLQSAIVVVDSEGKVVALSGGVGDKLKNRVWNRASRTKRPSGSAIKPLSVYGPALEMGLITPNTIVDDTPYQVLDGKAWPVNAVRYYKGLDTVRHALSVSSNTTAVRVLGDYVTPQMSYEFLTNRFHISSLVWERWIGERKFTDVGLAQLALGGLTDGVSVYEMAAAYAAFPNMGHYVPPRTYSKVVDSDGETVLLDCSNEGEYILKERTAYYMNSMLKDVVTSGTGKRANFSGMTIAGKTGTTTNEKDLWFVGYTPYYTAAVWTGYDRQERMSDANHAQETMWKLVMERVHEGLDNRDFPAPADVSLTSAEYCLDSGMMPTEFCPIDVRGDRVAMGTYAQGDQPSQYCTLHTELKVCLDDPILDEAGQPTGKYRRAGEHCPTESVKVMGILDLTRTDAAAMVETRDQDALLSSWPDEVCQVHNGSDQPGGEEGGFDPTDPSTWPLEDPNFNIEDPSTWPTAPAEPSQPGPEGGELGIPWESPTPSDSHQEEPSPSPEPPDILPPDEPFVPAGH